MPYDYVLYAYLGVQGAGFMQRKLAGQLPLLHTIAMDDNCLALRLLEKGGPLDLDNSYTIGNDFQDSVILKKKFKDRVYWLGDALVLHRIIEGNVYELIMTRFLPCNCI